MPAKVETALHVASLMRLRPTPLWDLGPHQHDHVHELVFICQGCYQTEVAAGMFTLVTGDIVVYPRGLVHHPSYDFSSGLEMMVMTLTGELRTADGRKFPDDQPIYVESQP